MPKAIGQLVRVLAPGGNLLVTMSLGRPRLQKAHRVYDHEAFATRALEFAERRLIVATAKRDGILRLLMFASQRWKSAHKRIRAPLAFRRYKSCYMFNCRERCSI
jgi:hypothetical protein